MASWQMPGKARQGPMWYPALGKHRNNENYEKGPFIAHFPRISQGYSTEMLSYVSLPEGTGKKKTSFLEWLVVETTL